MKYKTKTIRPKHVEKLKRIALITAALVLITMAVIYGVAPN